MKKRIVYLCTKLTLVYCFIINVPAYADISVAMVGDSITQGVPYRETEGNGCTNCGVIEPKLEALMDSDTNTTGTVYNYGISGEWSRNGADRIQDIIDVRNPDMVLYMEGTNDLFWSSPSTVKANVEYAMNEILDNGKIALIGTLLPDTRDNANNDKDIPGTNTLIRDMIAQQQATLALQNKYVYLVELYNADSFSGWASKLLDGLHPNDTTGAQLAADVWYTAVQEALKPRTDFLPAIYLLLLE